MGFRNVGEVMNVTKMNNVPKTEKQDVTRSVVSNAFSWPTVKPVAMVAE